MLNQPMRRVIASSPALEPSLVQLTTRRGYLESPLRMKKYATYSIMTRSSLLSDLRPNQETFAWTLRLQNHHYLLRRSFTSTSSTKGQNSSSNGTSSPSTNGSSNWWIRLGWTLLGLVVIDQALQVKQGWEDEEKQTMLRELQINADEADVNQADVFDATQPTLFECRVSHFEPSLDGTKMLTRKVSRGMSVGSNSSIVKRGDVVEVIEANVGPNRAYHLCRVKDTTPTSDNGGKDTTPFVGWYPIKFLEQVE